MTLEPVTTRLDVDVTRRFLDEMPDESASAEEIEMPEDETIEPLRERIDLEVVMIEALALALPDYPRKDDPAPVVAEFTPPGATPIEEEPQKPFAGLADLKKKLEGDEVNRINGLQKTACSKRDSLYFRAFTGIWG